MILVRIRAQPLLAVIFDAGALKVIHAHDEVELQLRVKVSGHPLKTDRFETKRGDVLVALLPPSTCQSLGGRIVPSVGVLQGHRIRNRHSSTTHTIDGEAI